MLTPLSLTPVKTYSDARNILTGVLGEEGARNVLTGVLGKEGQPLHPHNQLSFT